MFNKPATKIINTYVYDGKLSTNTDNVVSMKDATENTDNSSEEFNGGPLNDDMSIKNTTKEEEQENTGTNSDDSITKSAHSEFYQSCHELLESILDELEIFRHSHREKSKQENKQTEWMLVGEILDRFSLIVFIIVIVILHLALLLNHG